MAPGDPLSIIYTSGTTGPPKGALLTHEGAMTNIHNYLFEWDLRRDDVTVVVNPIFHVVLYILCVPLLYKGGRVVLLEDFDAATALRLAQAEGVTVWFAIPTAWQMIFDSPAFAASIARDFASLARAGPRARPRSWTASRRWGSRTGRATA